MFSLNKTNIILLLHASICRGKFLKAHSYFCSAIRNKVEIFEDDYFIAASKLIIPVLIENKENFKCWKRLWYQFVNIATDASIVKS